jgi:phage-related protein
MPAAIAGIAGVIGGAAAAVTGAVAGIASLIGGAVAGLTSAIGGIAGSVVGTIGSVVGGVSTFLSDVGKFLTGSLNFDLAKIGKSIADTAGAIAGGLSTAIKAVTVPITETVTWTKKVFLNRYQEFTKVIDNVAYPILNPIKETLQTVKTVVDAVKEPVDALMEPVKLVRETISDISSLKIIGDVLDGTAKISDLLGPVAEGKTAETAAAIAELTKAIATTTVGTIDKVDVEFKMLGATIDTFDERIKTSVAEKVAISKAEILAKVTPRLDRLGKYQAKVISGIARLSRHIEDEQWFAFMLLRALS